MLFLQAKTCRLTLTLTKNNRMATQNTPTTGVPPLAPLIVARRAPLLVRKETKKGVRLIIMRKVKWTLIEFADLHGERHPHLAVALL